MGNAFVEKLKELGLKHGEKAGLAIASMVFLMCIGMAATQKTIGTTPDQIKAAAKASESNLNRREDRSTIIQKLVDKGIKETDFAKVVDEQVKTALVPASFKSDREWIIPEPGAGLLRDTPKLIAATQLYAYPGRGGFLVFELDEDGNRIPDKEKKEAPKDTSSRRRRRRRSAMGAPSGGMMGMMGMRKKSGKSKAEQEREAKVERERKTRELQNKLAGPSGGEDVETAKSEQTAKEFPDKEMLKGFRWVAVTGVLDHAQMRANYRDALKNPAVAHPHYRRLDLQRQILQPDGTWSRWQTVDAKKNLDILENICEEVTDEDELTPPTVRPEGLVDSLPFLKNGLWEKVHVASLVPKEKKDIPKVPSADEGFPGMGGMGGMGGMMGRMMGRGQMNQMMGGMSNMGNMMAQGGGDRMMRGGMMAGMGMGMGMGGMMGGGTETLGNQWKSEEKKVMVRALDFTVDEDTTYRYRTRIVVWNPNLNRDDVLNASVDTKSEELRGPWSEPTDAVAMPPDVMPYAMGTLPKSSKSDSKISFQVIRFHEADGVTVPSTFEAAPGEVIGELRPRAIPSAEGTGPKSKPIDFGTRQIVLDSQGGDLQALPSGLVGPALRRPAFALLLRSDGSVIVHSEADDASNEVRKDIAANYQREIDQSSKKRESSQGIGGMGMMGGMMRSMMGMGRGK
jgi:hypothetical protein